MASSSQPVVNAGDGDRDRSAENHISHLPSFSVAPPHDGDWSDESRLSPDPDREEYSTPHSIGVPTDVAAYHTHSTFTTSQITNQSTFQTSDETGMPSDRPPTPPRKPTEASTPRLAFGHGPGTPSRSVSARSSSSSRGTAIRGSSITGQHTTSLIFVQAALDMISASKDARKRKELGDSVQRAQSAIKASEPELPDPVVIFEPLKLACQSSHVPLVVLALDCIGKLISYSYFSLTQSLDPSLDRHGSRDGGPLIDRAIECICDCFQGESTPTEVQLQIVKSLLFAILNDQIVVHGNGLLLAIRQTYNIFLLSRSSVNQELAQGALTQMVSTVFERLEIRIKAKVKRDAVASHTERSLDINTTKLRGSSGSLLTEVPITLDSAIDDGGVKAGSTSPGGAAIPEKITLQSFENPQDFDEEATRDNAPTVVTQKNSQSPLRYSRVGQDVSSLSEDSDAAEDEHYEIYAKDAYLVFRAMCKLSIKAVPPDQIPDLKSQAMRSKLLSLHMIHSILLTHVLVFKSSSSTINSHNDTSPSLFLHAVKQYLCLSLSRNGGSSVRQVFDVSRDIFWLMLRDLRVTLKREAEVFMKEIYLTILDRRNAPSYQRQSILDLLKSICSDPRLLVELYLNYDCDKVALENIYQRIIEHLARIASTKISMSSSQTQAYWQEVNRVQPGDQRSVSHNVPPSLSSSAVSSKTHDTSHLYPIEFAQKQEALRALVGAIHSLLDWLQESRPQAFGPESSLEHSAAGSGPSSSPGMQEPSSERLQSPTHTELDGRQHQTENATGDVDDPTELGRIKQQKTALSEAISAFNFKPKKAIPLLVDKAIIPTNSAEDIALFLWLNNRSLDKAVVGEYLGEGEAHNVATMHAFVDLMDFANKRFVDALRRFLQYFRLPGEAQKIDRFLLKFAQRYVTGNPGTFANADTAYVLAYSVIMLNTELHSVKVKGRRMTQDDFVKNNRGINDNADLPAEYLTAIYDEIQSNEIVLYSERDAAVGAGAMPTGPGGIVSGIGNAFSGDRSRREAVLQVSEHMANKTEQLFRSLARAQRRDVSRSQVDQFIPATSIQHLGPMFEVTWMSFLSGISANLLATHEVEVVRLCLAGLRQSIRIACVFDLRTPRQAFVSALATLTNLGYLGDMMARNLEALKILLEVALEDGEMLAESWREVFTCISQLERLQLMSAGAPENVLPDLNSIRINHRESFDNRTRKSVNGSKSKKSRNPSNAANLFRPEVAHESRSTGVIIAVDRVFSTSSRLSGEAIVHFVRALSEVSWQEIQASGHTDSPRTFCLQKLVEISYYNMKRVRIEWTNIWQVLGEHFNEVGCHSNTDVVYFALDSLRQLSMRFMEIAELPGFAFQKDFLKPFEHIISNSTVVSVKDMVLRCMSQMIHARGENIRSGWKTMFGVFTVAAQERYEGLVNSAYDHVTKVYEEQFGMIIAQGAFVDLTVCLTAFSKNDRYQRKALSAIELLRSLIRRLVVTPECPLSNSQASSAANEPPLSSSSAVTTQRSQEEQYWFPILFAFHDVLMTGEDLEVRSRALNFLFETLIRYGGSFPRDFWDTLWRQLLFPIFMVLRSRSEMTKVLSHEELSVWLSTTMIQALRNMIKLFTHYFQSLQHMLDRFLDLLTLCICQENDTIARIGSNCLQQIILQNVNKFEPSHWTEIVASFISLFERTTAYQLFSSSTDGSRSTQRPSPEPPVATPGDASSILSDLTLTSPLPANVLVKANGAEADNQSDDALDDDSLPAQRGDRSNGSWTATEAGPESSQSGQQQPEVSSARRRYFNKIITKCVLQLLMIETVQELFSNDAVYARIPSPELLRLMTMLKRSYQFAKRFNEDKELRMRLWREGFMKQPPNLLKQESGSAATYINILLRMYHDDRDERRRNHREIEAALIPLCADIIQSYVHLDEETQQRNIVAWRSVVVDVLDGYITLPTADFQRHIQTFFPLAVDLLGRDLVAEIRIALQGLLRRVGEIHFSMALLPTPKTPLDSASSYSSRSRPPSAYRLDDD